MITGLDWSMPNADQNSGIDPNVDQFRLMPINSDQFYWCLDPALRGIDRHWEAFRINAMILIGIGHWSRESCDHHDHVESIEIKGTTWLLSLLF